MSANEPLEFSNDRPLTDKQHDRLNRSAFVNRIAGVLRGLPNGSSLVVGIYGPWGEGKTTVLNLLRSELSSSDAIVVRDFNPWRHTDDDAMLRGFFTVLAEAIGASLSTRFERAKTGAGKWTNRFRWFTKPAGWLSKSAETLDDLLARFGEVAATGDSVGLEELRGRIITRLEQSAMRVVVLIDDLDRLDKHESHILFRLIKACADFPNVCYVLAFDDTVVAKALGERYGGGDEPSGRAFLEKIIQIPLKLPAAAKEDLRGMCFEQVDRALTATGIELTKDQIGEFIAGFDRGVSVRLTTPRGAKRFGNGLMFALPMLVGEANPVDLLLVEALRAFFPEVYDIVRDNHSEFSGVEKDQHGGGDGGPRSAELLQPKLAAMPKEHALAAQALLVDLFPRMSGVFGHSNYGSDWLSRWSRERRISAPEYCARYFTYTIPRNDVPDAAVAAMLDAASQGNAAAVETYLTTYLTGSTARRVIEKLRAFEATVDPISAETLAIVMAKLGKNIPNPPALFSFAEPPSQAAILISHLLRRIPNRAARISAAKRVVEIAEPLWFGVECVRWLYVSDKPEKQDSNTLTKQETADMRQVLVERIKSHAAAGALLFDPELPQEASLLFEWWRAEGRDPVQAHLIAVFTKDPKQVARFLQSQAPLAWSEGDVMPHISELDANQLKNMRLIIDLDTMADWIREHCPGDFDNPEWFPDKDNPLEQRLAEQFMFVYNKWKKDGEPEGVGGMNKIEPDEEKGLGEAADEDRND
ncbi:MAG: P-loop NTPase fold protein [Acidobacteriota bacterium]|nr:P-loop NTPase fold protein [Acidobacteriota bacterium]